MSFTPPPSVSVPTPPPAPSRDDTDEAFDEKASAFVGWYSPFATWLSTFVLWLTTFTGELTAAITSVLNSVTQAENAASLAIGVANYAGEWSALPAGPLTKGATVSKNGQLWILKEDIADVTAEEPGVSTKWFFHNVAFPIVYTDLPAGTPSLAIGLNLQYAIRNAAGNTGDQTLIAPSDPQDGAFLIISIHNGLITNVFNPNGKTIHGVAENLVLDVNRVYFLRYINGTWNLL